MRLFATVDGQVDRADGADWLTPPFDLPFWSRMRLFGILDGRIDRYDRAGFLTPPFSWPFQHVAGAPGFYTVWNRLTWREVLFAEEPEATRGLLGQLGYVSDSDRDRIRDIVPDELKAAAILDGLHYNGNHHSANDGASYISLLRDPADPDRRLLPWQVEAQLKRQFGSTAASMRTFLEGRQGLFSSSRIDELLSVAPTSSSADPEGQRYFPCWCAPGNGLGGPLEGSSDGMYVQYKIHAAVMKVDATRERGTSSWSAIGATYDHNGDDYHTGDSAYTFIYWLNNSANPHAIRKVTVVQTPNGGTSRFDITLAAGEPLLDATPGEDDWFAIISTPANAKARTDAHPQGWRSMRWHFAALPYRTNDPTPVTRFDGFWDDQIECLGYKLLRHGLWDTHFGTLWQRWWTEYSSIGGVCDRFEGVMEFARMIWTWRSMDSGSLDLLLLANADKTYWTNEMGFDWSEFNLDEARYRHNRLWNSESRNPEEPGFSLAQRFKAVVMDEMRETINTVMYAPLATLYPNVKFCEYQMHTDAPGTHNSPGWGVGASPGPLSPGGCVGSMECQVARGIVHPMYDWSAGSSSLGRQHDPAGWRQFDTTRQPVKWDAFVNSVILLTQSAAASTRPRLQRVAWKQSGDPASGYPTYALWDTPLWYDLVFAAALLGNELFYWNGGLWNDAAHRYYGHGDDAPYRAVLREWMEIVPKVVTPVVGAPIKRYRPAFVAIQGDSGGRFVWRIVHSPLLSWRMETGGGNVRFIYGNGEELLVPQAGVITVSPPNVPCSEQGTWVASLP